MIYGKSDFEMTPENLLVEAKERAAMFMDEIKRGAVAQNHIRNYRGNITRVLIELAKSLKKQGESKTEVVAGIKALVEEIEVFYPKTMAKIRAGEEVSFRDEFEKLANKVLELNV